MLIYLIADVEWLGPVPDPEAFVPLRAMPPDHTGKELIDELEKLGHIKSDFTISEDAPMGPPK